MNQVVQLLLVIGCLSAVTNGDYSQRVGIIQNDSDKKLCGSGNMSHEVFEHLSSAITSSTSMVVCPERIQLMNIVSFKDLVDIEIQGKNKNTEINCENESGFKFINVTRLSLRNLKFSGCSMKTLSDQSASLSFINSLDVQIFEVSIKNSTGTGLLVKNTTGDVGIQNCVFKGNGQHASISFYYVSIPSAYNISECIFEKTVHQPESGGGLNIAVEHSKRIKILVASADFMRNNATKGGGISISYSDSQNCTIEVVHSNFTENNGKDGGGVYVKVSSLSHTSLNISMKDCAFDNNNATLGGGTKISSTRLDKQEVFITFLNVSWTRNTAFYGSAFFVAPDFVQALDGGFVPCLRFIDSRFMDNNVYRKFLTEEMDIVQQYKEGTGGFYCFNFQLKFGGVLVATNNNGCAFHLEFCTIHFLENSSSTFDSNEGYYGGALHLRSSQIVVSSGVQVNFWNNIAYKTGGAIHWYTCTTFLVEYSNSCFILKETDRTKEISFNFFGNYRKTNAKERVDSIYALSLEACKPNESSLDERTFFSGIGSFNFEPRDNNIQHISTAPKQSNIINIDSKVTEVVPGKPFQISTRSVNDLNENTIGFFEVRLRSIGSNIGASHNAVLNNSMIDFYGSPNSTADVLLSTVNLRKITLEFGINFIDCPPGFFFNDNKCICITKHVNVSRNDGIECDIDTYSANRSSGLWVTHTVNKDDLKSGYCPLGYCSDENQLEWKGNISKQLNVCREGREGVLCGACIDNYSVYYHSHLYSCGETDSCSLGWLLYLLTEILPVTILFVAIIYSGKSVSSGLTTGFIFYAQVLQNLRIGGEKYFKLPHAVVEAQQYVSLFYNIFNLDFFVHEKLSFCLWKNADSLSIMAMDYFTQAYSLALVFVAVILVKYSHRLHCMAGAVGIKLPSTARSTVHGITAFLILTCSQNVTTSIAMIRPGFIYHSNDTYSTVVHYMGQYSYCSRSYIPYAILASMVLTFFFLVPTFLLLLYPIHYKILFRLKLSESKYVVKLVHPLEKLKPLFDSFQSNFKDNCRFFSGLYFLYRLIIGLTFIINTPVNYYIWIEVELIAILIIHSVCQPFKETLHNIVNSLLLGNLALINTISILHLYHKMHPQQILLSVKITGAIQVLLLYVPVVVVVGYVSAVVYNFLKACLRRKEGNQVEVSISLVELDSDVDRKSNYEPSVSYKLQSTGGSINYS